MRRAALAALFGFMVAAALMVVLHTDERLGGTDPVTLMLSDYAMRPGWWLWVLALVVTSASTVLLSIALRHRRIITDPLAWVGLVGWCVSLVLVAAFTKDPQGGAVTTTGKLHLYATGITCVSLPLTGWALGRRHRDHVSWRRYALWTRRLSWWSVPFFLPFLVPFAVNVLAGALVFPAMPTGLIERAMIFLDMVLLVVLALWVRHAGHSARGEAWSRTDRPRQ